ncbi:peptidoglycan-recognition protein SC2-like [Copidosoma floridanum]|uniref:peptidoglycan-recognition protein SC2-like n=1 Tax=Copidosoma floridanum TaxID=29053 RepID=UPI0006C97CED|nr:peptidoglycan-recognition protein SC2-like [Copidosoma floridanum]
MESPSLMFKAVILFIGIIMTTANDLDPGNDFEKKSEDVRIIKRVAWGAQPATDSPRHLKVQPAPYAIISHTATQSCYNKAKCILNVRVIQTFHIEAKGWLDVGYNFLVGGDGNVYEGRGWDMAGAHTHNYNNRSIGIAFVGDFSYKSPTKEQIAVAEKLLESGVKSNKLVKDYKLIGQRQVVHTQSPGDKLFAIIRAWEHFTSNP